MYSLIITRTKTNGFNETIEGYSFDTLAQAESNQKRLLKCDNIKYIRIKKN